MITCPVCNSSNHHLAVTCKSCGSFIQKRVENLDLFSVAWKVIEHPSQAFHDIAVARHKNYAFFLASVAGIGLSFGLFWAVHAAEFTDSILSIIAAGLVTGPVAGILTFLFLAAILTALATLGGVSVRYRNSMAVVAYAFLPLVLCTVISIPMELLSFGTFFYSSNPSPYILKPVSYMMILGLKFLFSLWMVALMIVGSKELFGSGWLKSLIITIVSIGLVAGIFIGLVAGLLPRNL